MKLNAPLKLFLLILILLLTFSLFPIFGKQAVIWSLLFLFFTLSWVIFLSAVTIKRFLKTSLREGHDPWKINAFIKNQSLRLDIKAPQLLIAPYASAFSLSVNSMIQGPSIILSQGLIDRFSLEEIKPLITFEMIKIKRKLNWSQQFSFFFIHLIYKLSYFFGRLFSLLTGIKAKNLDSKTNIIIVFRPLIFFFIYFSLLKKDLTELDSLTAQLTSKEQYGLAIWKLIAYQKTIPYPGPRAVVHLFNHKVNMLQSAKNNRVLDPKSDSFRIRSIVGRYPV
jgi:hypothetical protein